jgi:hypothetical protein
MKIQWFLFVLLIASVSYGQDIKVEYDKKLDFTQFKTFRFGEGEVITPEDQQVVSEGQMNKWVQAAVSRELEAKGLTRVDSSADLIVSYAIGAMARSDAGSVGPMGLTPGSMERNYSRDYSQGSFVIDLNNRNNILVWRINATSSSDLRHGEDVINEIVAKGFKKFGQPEKKKKKK